MINVVLHLVVFREIEQIGMLHLKQVIHLVNVKIPIRIILCFWTGNILSSSGEEGITIYMHTHCRVANRDHPVNKIKKKEYCDKTFPKNLNRHTDRQSKILIISENQRCM